jgi:DNA-binding transcriptional MerR regulator
MAGTLTIADLHQRTGKPSSALRFYERELLLAPIGRQGGMRIYKDSAIRQIALIDLLQLAGFTLGEIRRIVSPDGEFSVDWREQARGKIDALDRRLAEIELAKAILQHTVNCPHESLDHCPVFHQGIEDHAVTLAEGGRPPRPVY